MADESVFDKFKKAVVDTVNDLTTVDVMTIDAKDIKVSLQTKNGSLKADDFFARIQAGIPKSEAKLVAITHVDLDLDTVIVADSEGSETLLKAHNEAVKVAQDSRLNIVKLVKDTLTDKL